MIERRSALAGHPLLQAGARTAAGPATPQLTLAERRMSTLLQVSAFAQNIDEAGARLASLLGMALPGPNRYTGEQHQTLRSVGPGVWQISGDATADLPQASTLRVALAGVATVVDLGHARTTLQLRGSAAAQVIAKHCSLDLGGAHFPVGSATQTRFGHIGMGLARTGDAPVFELTVFRGYAEFVFEALVESGREFGLRVAM